MTSEDFIIELTNDRNGVLAMIKCAECMTLITETRPGLRVSATKLEDAWDDHAKDCGTEPK